MTTFEAAGIEVPPDGRKICLLRAEKIYTLTTCNLAVKGVFSRDLTEDDEFFWSNLASRNAGNDGEPKGQGDNEPVLPTSRHAVYCLGIGHSYLVIHVEACP